jgi:hypothetical protein
MKSKTMKYRNIEQVMLRKGTSGRQKVNEEDKGG